MKAGQARVTVIYSVSDSNTSQRGKEIIWAGHYISLVFRSMDSHTSFPLHKESKEYQHQAGHYSKVTSEGSSISVENINEQEEGLRRGVI